jgi:uncharacterized membrane protein YhhN
MIDNLVLKGYIGVSSIYLLTLFLGIEGIAWFFKPLLLPFLLYAVYKSDYFPTKKNLLSALVFSWLGDIVLMFASQGEMYFIIGLVLFLVSHAFYIELFLKQKSDKKVYKRPLFWIGCGIVLFYLYNMLTLLLPTLGDLRIPVAIYAVTISIMLMAALRIYFSRTNKGKYLVVAGAVSFVASDSFLAIDKFHEPLPHASLLIMVTYLLAQYCIAVGILNLNQKK